MRTFLDALGREWDAIVGKESWGTLVLLFTPRDGGEVRRTVLASETAFDATEELERLTDDELRALLADAQPWS